MAGIGEASAILTVAEAGFSLASKLKDLFDDYKNAAGTIEKLREELEATSKSLQNLGEFAEQNGLHNKNAVADAKILTDRCQRTISDIKTLMRLESVPSDPASTSSEAELTRLDRVKWVFSKSKLQVPRAELARLKLDMMLLYFTLMTYKAHTKEEQQRFKNKIPGVAKELQWANAQYEKILNRSKNAEERTGKFTRGKEVSRKQPLEESDRREMEDYLEFLKRRGAEQRERRAQEILAFRQRQEEQKRSEEDQKKKEIGDAAVLEYKSQKKEEEEKAELTRKQSEALLQKLLTKAGVDEDKIGLVLKDMASTSTAQTRLLKTAEPLFHAQPEVDHRLGPTTTAAQRSTFSRIFRRGTRVPSGQSTLPPSLEPASSVINAEQALEKPYDLQAWVINRSSDVAFEVPISEKLLSHLLAASQGSKREKSLLERFSLLEPFYQREINRLCFGRDLKPGPYWALIYLAEVRGGKKGGLWRRIKEVARVQIVLRKEQFQSGEAILVGPRTDQKGDGPTMPGDQKDDTASRTPYLSSNNPLVDPVAGRTPEPDPDMPHSRKQDHEHEIVQRTRRNYSGRESLSKGPLLAETVEEIIVNSNGAKRTKKVTTEIIKDAIDTRVVRDSGYDFVEERGKILVPMGLGDSELNQMHEWSKFIRRMDGKVTDEQDARYWDNRIARSPHVTWELPQSSTASADDLAYRDRETNNHLVTYNSHGRRTLSQPGKTGFVLSRSGRSEERSSQYPFAAQPLYHEYRGNELMKYDSQSGNTRPFARNEELEGLLPRQEYPRFSRNSAVGVPSQLADNRNGTIFLNERSESPHDYTGTDRGRRPSLGRSNRRGSPTSYPRRHYPSSIYDDWPGSGLPRPIRRGRAVDESGHEWDRPRSRERRRPSSFSQARAYRKNRDGILSSYGYYDNARSRDAYVGGAAVMPMDSEMGTISRSRSQTMPTLYAPYMTAQHGGIEVVLDREDDLGNSSDDQIALERRQPERDFYSLRAPRWLFESETEGSDQEDAQSPDKATRSHYSGFEEERARVIAAGAEDVTQLPDSEIIERQLARYRDNQSPVRVVDETPELTPEEAVQGSGSPVSYMQVGAASIGDKSAAALHGPEVSTREAGDSAAKSSDTPATAIEPGSLQLQDDLWAGCLIGERRRRRKTPKGKAPEATASVVIAEAIQRPRSA